MAKDADFLRPLIQRIPGKAANEFVIQPQAYRAKSLVMGDNFLGNRGLGVRSVAEETEQAHD
jgi:hypothetical protein